MKTIDELQAELRRICSELEVIKESQKADTREVNFREIAARAERYPISNHPMVNTDEHTKDMYLLMLLSTAALDDEKYEESFMTIYRIAYGMCFSGDLEALFLSAKQMKFETLDECTRLFIGSNLRLVLLLECMMVAAGFERGKRRAMEYISQLAVMLNIGKDEIEFLANLARVVLTQDLNEYKTDKLNVYGNVFDCYINVFEPYFSITLIYEYIVKKEGESVYSLESIDSTDNKQIIFNYQSVDLNDLLAGLPTGRREFSRVIDVSNVYQDYFVSDFPKAVDVKKRRSYVGLSSFFSSSIDDFISENSKYAEKPYLFGVTSAHPLAHSKAIAQFIAAGGVINNNGSDS